MAYRRDWIDYIRRNAPRYGVDPQAALAVASAEGLSGAVGDQGTSYGPWQLHIGDALPSGRGRGWAESQAGLDYALQQIAGVAKGQHGRQAVENIVRRFERPRDPSGEISRALGALGQFGGALPVGVGPGRASPPRAAPGPSPGVSDQVRQLLARALVSHQRPDWFALAAAKRAEATAGNPAGSRGAVTVPNRATMAAPPIGIGIAGKIIGTPGQGTHTLGNWESDRAYDEALPVGTPIRAPFDGTIGQQFGSLGQGGRFAGLRVHVVGKGNEAYLAHLSKFAPGIQPGRKVRKGQIIGYSGSANGVAHLHEALRFGDPRMLVPLT